MRRMLRRSGPGVSCWMFAILFLAVLQTCSTGLWSGAYGGRKIEGDAFQEPARLVEAGQRFRVVEPGIVQPPERIVSTALATRHR